MAKSPTVYDVASAAGVSTATVSFTFRNPDRVKESTREIVLAAAKRLGYVPNASARSLARGRTGALGLFAYDFMWNAPDRRVAPGQSLPGSHLLQGEPYDDFRLFPVYLDEVQRGFELQCWRRGFELILGGRQDETGENIINEMAGRVDGLAVFPRRLASDTLSHVSRRIPVVEFASAGTTDDYCHITADNAGGMAMIADHLISVHNMTDFIFVSSVTNADSEERRLSFNEELQRRGIAARPPLSHSLATITQDLAGLSGAGSLPQAFVCASDLVALEVVDALATLGVSVPAHVAVTGFDGVVAGAVSQPSITTIRQPMSDIGRLAADMLIARSSGETTGSESIVLRVRMIVRGSCGCA
ncbi:LacI family DNA-binding transcriptional regulator [Arthrobacter sp. efr-133-TYG-118]|uniref:LacI family DNA-binding transcriptional regulator n=1 Tax=Arthrobacter sp. efr-133-TYG-118 TaxID=3040279 RepID=UPI00254F4F31|nr:LacI family DNA-binding transcriptional regulator [Arthrobacter sp. efr-133-TYG-118]